MSVRVSELAQQQLAHIFDHIALDDIQAAFRVAEVLEEGMLSLDLLPQMWPRTSNPNIRKRIFPGLPYLVYYSIENKRDVTVLEVWDGRMEHLPYR